jgi:hypothetical protein
VVRSPMSPRRPGVPNPSVPLLHALKPDDWL